MPKSVYSYDPMTGQYRGIVTARESPEDLKQGKVVWHIPAHATEVAPPAPKALHATIWDGQKWTQNKLEQIAKTITIPTCDWLFEAEVAKAFPGLDIKIKGDLNAKTERVIVFHGIPDTEANQATLNAVIAAHTWPDTKIETASKVTLAIVEVMCTELKKVAPDFPDLATFKTMVNTLLDQK